MGLKYVFFCLIMYIEIVIGDSFDDIPSKRNQYLKMKLYDIFTV